MLSGAYELYIRRRIIEKLKMDFTVEVCENFFDFSRDLNRTNEIISSIYRIMLKQKETHPDIFEGIERRLCRASNGCMKADDFVKLTNTTFRNLVVPFNADEKSIYFALLFYISEWLYDQARLCVSGVAVEEIKAVIITLMAKKLKTEFQFDTKVDWYKFIGETEDMKRPSPEDEFDYASFFLGIGLTYLLTKL